MCSSQLCKAWMFIEFRLQFGVFFRILNEMHTYHFFVLYVFFFFKKNINSSRIYINLTHLFFWNECEIKKHTTLFNNFLCIFFFEFTQPIKNIKNCAALVSCYREWHESVKMVSFELLVTVTCHTFFENTKKVQFKEIVLYTIHICVKDKKFIYCQHSSKL